MTRGTGSNAKSRIGDDLVEAFNEMASFVRGEIELEYYEIEDSAIGAESLKKATVRRPHRRKA